MAPERALLEVAQACGELGYQLVAKAHPMERWAGWGREVLVSSPDAEIHLDTPIGELLASVDILVTRRSTAAIEALMGGVPVVVWEDPVENTSNPYLDTHGVLCKSENATLRALITKALGMCGDDFRASVRRLAGSGPADAARGLDRMLTKIEGQRQAGR
jgi:hypothetical protein